MNEERFFQCDRVLYTVTFAEHLEMFKTYALVGILAAADVGCYANKILCHIRS